MPRAGATIINIGQPGSKRNRVINAGFRYAQRAVGTTTLPALAYSTVDRWQVGYNTGDTLTRFSERGTPPPTGSKDSFGSLHFTSTHSGVGGLVQGRTFIEDINVKDLASKRGSLGVWLMSDSADTAKVILTDASSPNSIGSGADIIIETLTIPNDGQWYFYSLENVLLTANVVNGLRITISFENFLNISGTRNHKIGEIMFNEGAKVAPFRLFSDNEAEELIACQRYFEKNWPLDANLSATLYSAAVGYTTSAGDMYTNVFEFNTQKRITPIIVPYDNALAPNKSHVQRDSLAGSGSNVSVSQGGVNDSGFHLRITSQAAKDMGNFQCNWSADAEI